MISFRDRVKGPVELESGRGLVMYRDEASVRRLGSGSGEDQCLGTKRVYSWR